MKFSKIAGWLLLIAGVSIILWTLYSSYNIFTVEAQVPEIFKMEEPTADSQTSPGQIEDVIEGLVGEQLKKILPLELLPRLLNLMAWSIFAGIAIFGGSQISNLGIKLIKT